MTRPLRCSRAVLGPLVLALAITAVAGPHPAAAQTAPAPTPAAPTPAPATTAPATTAPTTTTPPATLANEGQLVSVAVELSRTSDRLDVVAAQAAAVQAHLASAQAALADVEQRVTTTQAEINQLQAQLTARAAVVYEQHSDQGAVLRVQHVLDVAAGVHYTNSASGSDARQLDQLNAAEAQLVQERSQRDAERQAISDDESRLQATEADLNAVRARDQAFLAQLGGMPIMGDARLTAAQLAAWFHSTGQVAHLANGTTIDDLTQIYIQEGAAEHVAGDLAFAQAIIETGSFGHALDNNFSGIGACDSCTSEIAFPTPRDGVRAQIQLLKSYADPDSRAATLANPPEPALFGGTVATAVGAYNSFSFKGAAPVWNVMGNGKWATDPDYATKVLELYARMIAFAAQHH
jgi:Mannosyl-glycoprotein endo-beta-N-acetylglucosaminidase